VEWTARVEDRSRFRVSLEYGKATADSAGRGTFELSLGDQRLTAETTPTGGGSTFAVRDVGEVVLDRGTHVVRVRPTAAGGSAVRLRRVVLTPVAP